MKGREHEKIAQDFVFIFAVVIIISFIWQIPFLSGIVTYFGSFWFIATLSLFILGSLLPDSDSEDMNSYIYFKHVFGISYLFKGLEFPISKLLKRPRGHRQSLHTIMGITLTSLILILILSFIARYFDLFQFKGAVLGFIFLFLGQFLHLICDKHFELT